MATKGKRRATSAPANESKSEKFRRLGVKRTTKAIKAIDGLANLAGSGYESTEEQKQIIIGALTDAVKRVQSRFAGVKSSDVVITL